MVPYPLSRSAEARFRVVIEPDRCGVYVAMVGDFFGIAPLSDGDMVGVCFFDFLSLSSVGVGTWHLEAMIVTDHAVELAYIHWCVDVG